MKTQLLNHTSENDKKALWNEYQMVPEQVERDVEILMLWIEKTPHLPHLPASKENEVKFWIENLLFLNRNSLEKTKECIDSYFTMRTLFPNVLRSDSALYSEYYEDVSVVLLPHKTEDGCRIFIIGFNNPDPLTFKIQELYQRTRLVFEAHIRSGLDFTQLYVILDIRNLVFGHMAQIDLIFLKQLLNYAKKMLPFRIRQVHLVYTLTFIEKLILILRPFFSKKIFERLHHHKTTDSLTKSLSPKILPKDLGGDLPDTLQINNEWKDLLKRKSTWFLQDDTLITDESIREKSPLDRVKMESVTGSFRQLSID